MLTRFLRSESPMFRDIALLILRISAGGAMLFAHGLPKLMGWAEKAHSFADPFGVSPVVSLGLAVFAEVFCSMLLLLGAVTRLAVIPPMITMLVAHLIIHSADPWGRKELSFLYLVIYVAIFLLGPGRFSVDGLLMKKRD